MAIAVPFAAAVDSRHLLMHWFPYARLITLTAGTLLPFFWMVVILGHRRQRNFERVFFFLCLALTLFCGSSLLALNAQLYYSVPPNALLTFAWTFLCIGLWVLPALVVHLHVEYASLQNLIAGSAAKYAWLAAAYLPAFVLLSRLSNALQRRQDFGFSTPSLQLGGYFQLWLFLSIIVAAYWQWRFLSASTVDEQKKLHRWLCGDFVLLDCAVLLFFLEQRGLASAEHSSFFEMIVLWGVIGPLIALIRDVRRDNVLQIGRQGNLIYAVSGIFLALLYLSFVRRASVWFEPYLPPEATAALLLFLPVVFFEPLQRLTRGLLRQTAQTEVDRAQKLMGSINEVARLGDLDKLRLFTERWLTDQLQLAEVHLSLDLEGTVPVATETRGIGTEESFAIHRGTQHLGSLQVRSHGAMISGETFAALEFLCEQWPAAFDLCGLIEEKLQLERELAERERLALVGQMAASISHNLKNPLGSIKTILQVQLERPDLPTSLRSETQMVLDEINRLSAKLNQLLQFSRLGVRPVHTGSFCNLTQVAHDVIHMLHPEAVRRDIALQLQPSPEHWVAANGEAVNDILTNLVLNAIEATPSGGHVAVELQANGSACYVFIEDDGSGIPPDLKEKVLQPFFTTKPLGTGLGLAIVQKRLEELGGTLERKSPASQGAGTRFKIALLARPHVEKP
ncbi:MAG: HAMP domain-containing sensor histidine kinase [Candidatus Acidiferrum sp.]